MEVHGLSERRVTKTADGCAEEGEEDAAFCVAWVVCSLSRRHRRPARKVFSPLTLILSPFIRRRRHCRDKQRPTGCDPFSLCCRENLPRVPPEYDEQHNGTSLFRNKGLASLFQVITWLQIHELYSRDGKPLSLPVCPYPVLEETCGRTKQC